MKKKITVSSGFLLDFISPKKSIRILLLLSLCFSLFFTLFKFNDAPPCFNADEASFGYNAYSLLKTGADEYGNTLPVRLKSFGDYKLPLYSYLSVPFIATVGLNEVGARSLNILLSLLFPFFMYFFIRELFHKDEIGAIGALLVSVSLGKGIIGRHAHEALLAAFLITLASYFFLKYLNYEKLRDGIFFAITMFLALFSYQSSRIFAVFFFIFAISTLFYKKKWVKVKAIFMMIFVIALSIFFITDVIYKPTRVENLFLFNDQGLKLQIIELRNEGGAHALYNKLTVGTREVISNEMAYFSPQFLTTTGDSNPRFGFQGMAPMTPIEYIFVFVGLYFLIKNKEKWRVFLLSLTVVSPLAAAFAWNGESLTRTMFLLVPLLTITAYGAYHTLLYAKQRGKIVYVIGVLLFLESVFLFYSWDFYLNHYSQRGLVIRSWQCGYKEVGEYIKDNYAKKEAFYITKQNGQPYIFTLFYLQYPPEQYQKMAKLSSADDYGFGQVEEFDKFTFSVPEDAATKRNAAIIGYPSDFQNLNNIDTNRIKKIIIGKEEMFWIYETQ